jgi:ribosomal protein S18 acetylase RimI-like enzyme
VVAHAAPQVRAATPGDVDAVRALWSQARSEHAVTPDTAEAVLRLLAHAPGALLVAEDRGEVVGVLIAAWDGWRGGMYRLAVRHDRRRRGIGRQLVAAGEAHLRRCGAPRVTALVAYEDERARAFWVALGYGVDEDVGRLVRSL